MVEKSTPSSGTASGTGVDKGRHGVAGSLETAMEHQRAGRLGEAAAICHDIVQRYPDHVGALNVLGLVEVQNGQPLQAMTHFAKALVGDPTNSALYANMGLALGAIGRRDEAIETFEKAIHLRADYREAHHNVSVLLRDAGRLGDAERHARQSIALAPDLPDTHSVLGTILEAAGRTAEALAEYRTTVMLAPNHVPGLTHLGTLLGDLDQPEEAVEHLQRAVTLQPRAAQARLRLVETLRRLGRGQDAETVLWGAPRELSCRAVTVSL
ncbi:MAG: tetratricopeptide repeat protein [Alphaproteobacteria bacterium]